MAYLESLRVFCRVVELGSITSGGRDLRLTPAVASKRIKANQDCTSSCTASLQALLNAITVNVTWISDDGNRAILKSVSFLKSVAFPLNEKVIVGLHLLWRWW